MFATLMGLKSVSCREVSDALPQRRLTVFDVNPNARWAAAHVPGARNLDPEVFRAEDLPGDKEAPLVFYCSNVMCRKAPIAARRARTMGHADVSVMSAGIQGWLAAKLPVESTA